MFYINLECNLKIAVYDLNTTSSKVILMIHGWPLSEKIFEYQKQMLVNEGYRVITIDLRGFGNSDASASGYVYDQFAMDIYHVIRSLNINHFTLVGFSMGGAIALRYMGLFNGYGVNKLCLLGAAAPCYTKRTDFPYGVSVESVDQLIYNNATDRALACDVFSKKLLNNPHSLAIKNWFRDIALSATGIATVQSAYSLRDEDCREDIKKINVPTGIFHGTQDQIVPYELGLIQHQMIEGSLLYTFEKSGHGVMYDELNLFNKRFKQFLGLHKRYSDSGISYS